MTTFVVAHGPRSAGWVWKKMHPRLGVGGDRLVTPTVFRPFAQRARREGWGYCELDASHNPHVTEPDALAAVLRRIAAQGP